MKKLHCRAIPSNKKCKLGARLALENANRHLHCATHLSEIKEYGLAQAHLVLGVEEAIKAYFLYLKGIGLPVRQKVLINMLSRHQARLEFGGASHMIYNVLKWIVDSITKTVNELHGKTKSEANTLMRNTYKQIAFELQKSISSPENHGEINLRVMSIRDWWEAADARKEIGFYVDYHGGKWLTPSLIEKKEYQYSLIIAREIIEITEQYFIIFESLPSDKQFKLLKRMRNNYRNRPFLK